MSGLLSKSQTFKHVVAVFILMAGASVMFYWLFQAYVLEKAEENVKNILLSHKGIHHYVQNIMIPAYSKYQTDGDIKPEFYAPELLSSSYIVRNQHKYYNAERKIASLTETYYKLAAKNPRNPINKADKLEVELIERFNKNSELKSYKEIIEINGKKVLYVAIPFLKNEDRCMKCHGDRQNAPIELQESYPGLGGFNERTGEIRAITSIRAPLEDEYWHLYVIGSAIFVGFFAFSGLFFFNARLRSMVQKRTVSLEEEIVERKNAEKITEENRSMLTQILNTTPQSIFWKDKNGVYLGCNKVFSTELGMEEPGEIVGLTDWDLPWPKEHTEAYVADDKAVMTSNKPRYNIIEPLQFTDGKKLWIDTTKVPLVNSEGEVYGILGVFEDITDRILAEMEKEELEKRLRQSQKMESLGTLAGGIAHDFNNILAIIMGYAELAENEEDSEKLKEDLSQIKKGGKRAIELVKQILTFSRRTENSKLPLQLSVIVKESLKMLRASIPTTIDIKQNIKSSGIILADPTQINQVLMNLCINAYHAMRETGGTLSVNLDEIFIHAEDEGFGKLPSGSYLKLEVSDTGCGISAEYKERIFEPYFTTKKTGEGTGLGLAVVHGIVNSHHGSISVYSEIGKGTSFHVYLPLVESKPSIVSEDLFIESLEGHGEKILVVDDESQITEVVKRHLEISGYEVVTKNDSTEALEEFMANSESYHLIITDMNMPKMNGAELAEKIFAKFPNMPIILCTGHSDLINKEKAEKIGICEFLRKPVLRNDLLTATKKSILHSK